MKKILVVGLVGYSLFYELDHNPQIGESIITKSITKEIGGKGFNQAYMIHKLGGNVKFISTIGDDEFKPIIMKDLSNTSLCSNIIYKQGPNAVASILSYKNTNNVFVSIGVKLTKDDFNLIKEDIDHSDILLLTNELDEELLQLIINYAKANNKYIIFNQSPFKFNEYLNNVDLMVMNEIEYNQFQKENNKKTPFDIIITNGAKDTIYISKHNEIFSFNIEKANNVLDTTGAGDIFLGSLTYMLSQKENIEDINKETIHNAIEFASKKATKSVNYKYVLESIKQSSK